MPDEGRGRPSGRPGRSRRRGTRTASLRRLDTPNLTRLVGRLSAEALHHVIQERGIDACSALIAAATPHQLESLLDLDLWRPSGGREDQFDAHRFGVWLEALMNEGETVAARVVATIDPSLTVIGLSRYVRVFDPAVVPTITSSVDGLACEVGGYVVHAKTTDVWDAIVSLLVTLHGEHQDCFHSLMQGCRRLSNSTPEPDGFHGLLLDPEQLLYEVTVAREQRRTQHGYVTPGEASAFLEMARQPRRSAPDGRSSPNPIAMAYFRTLADDVAAKAEDRELAFLANALRAGCTVYSRPFTAEEAWNAAAGICNLGLDVQSARLRPTGPGAEPISTLALTLRDSGQTGDDLVTAFETGWRLLHEHVGMHVAERLIATLADVQNVDSDIQRDLYLLRRELVRHRDARAPWHALESLDVIAILDMPTWACLSGLLSECPVLPAAVPALLDGHAKSVSATAFECFATRGQIRIAHEFASRLRDLLH
jgi:hypothetical protein